MCLLLASWFSLPIGLLYLFFAGAGDNTVAHRSWNCVCALELQSSLSKKNPKTPQTLNYLHFITVSKWTPTRPRSVEAIPQIRAGNSSRMLTNHAYTCSRSWTRLLGIFTMMYITPVCGRRSASAQTDRNSPVTFRRRNVDRKYDRANAAGWKFHSPCLFALVCWGSHKHRNHA